MRWGFNEQNLDDQQTGTDDDRAVGDVKGGPTLGHLYFTR
jgi:hypothetical protein